MRLEGHLGHSYTQLLSDCLLHARVLTLSSQAGTHMHPMSRFLAQQKRGHVTAHLAISSVKVVVETAAPVDTRTHLPARLSGRLTAVRIQATCLSTTPAATLRRMATSSLAQF